MNSDQIKSAITHFAGIGLGWAAGRYHLSTDQVGAVMSDIGYAGAVAAWLAGVWQHKGMIKVPAAAAIFLVIGAALAFNASPASAADVSPPVVAKAAPLLGSVCSPTGCTGLYVGGWMAGNGTNANIIGSGLNGSVFGAGGLPGITAGYQFANGTWFAAAEASVGYQINIGGAVNNEGGLYAEEILKLGGQLNLLGSTTAPIGIPQQIAAQLISPYVLIGGVERGFANGWATGAGAEFDLAPHLFLDLRYEYVNYGGGAVNGATAFNAENIVRLGLNYKF